MSNALLVEYYDQLTGGGDLREFARRVEKRYTEGTLQRLLTHADGRVREAALVGLRFVGTLESNPAVAACLHDEQTPLRELAEGTLWTLWTRADGPSSTGKLQRLAKKIADEKFDAALTGLNALIAVSPQFAEAYNQRAILHWRRGEYQEAIADCRRVLDLNPFHFGALAGMGQCWLQLKQPSQALQAFRRAYEINPNLEGVADSIQAIEHMLNDEGRR